MAAASFAACDSTPSEPTPAPALENAEPPAELKPPALTEPTIEKARALAHKFIILDGHVDLPYRLQEDLTPEGKPSEDVNGPMKGDFDHPRAKAGGLDAPFMSVYIPARLEMSGATKLADELIDMVEGFVKTAPDKFALAKSPTDVRANFAKGLISLPMGMENGAPLEGKLANLAHFHERGIRYITLTHSKDNHICDSSYDERHTHKGLSNFGKKVVPEMNRLGIMIDVAHISDDTFWQVMELSTAPVIASHSSCRHFTPGFERNMSDDMIKKLAEKDGVIQINFGSTFLDADVRASRDKRRSAIKAEYKVKGLDPDAESDKASRETVEKAYDAKHPPAFATVAKVADHIDHVREIVGVEHVGLGSDFDGVGDSLPVGLKDASMYPQLILELLRRGYSEAEIEKVCSGNVLRVWEAVEAKAKRL